MTNGQDIRDRYIAEMRLISPLTDHWLEFLNRFAVEHSVEHGRSERSVDLRVMSTIGPIPIVQMRLNDRSVRIEVPFDRWTKHRAFQGAVVTRRLREMLGACGFPVAQKPSVPSLRLEEFTPRRESDFSVFLAEVVRTARALKA